jgi:hypothetical protein
MVYRYVPADFEHFLGTERRSWVVNTYISYSGGPGFKSQPGDRLP